MMNDIVCFIDRNSMKPTDSGPWAWVSRLPNRRLIRRLDQSILQHQNLAFHALDHLIERHDPRFLLPAMLQLDTAFFERPFADGQSQRHSAKVGLGEFRAGAALPVVVQHLDAGLLKLGVQLLGRLDRRLLWPSDTSVT